MREGNIAEGNEIIFTDAQSQRVPGGANACTGLQIS